jgi:hypothetical protein
MNISVYDKKVSHNWLVIEKSIDMIWSWNSYLMDLENSSGNGDM